jgi:outer membrane protein TolC
LSIATKSEQVNPNSEEKIVKSRVCRQPSQHFRICHLLQVVFFIFGIQLAVPAFAEEPNQEDMLNVRQSVEIALDANLAVLISKDEVEAARSTKKVQRSNLLPTLNTTYSYRRDDEEASIGGIAVASKNEYNFALSFNQPIFRGFDLINQYRIADLGLDAAEVNENVTRLNVIFETKNTYFTVLKRQKLVMVGQDTVKNLRAQEEVSRNFYEVGMRPLNDLLQVQVRVANAMQNLITAQNDLQVAESEFNVVLRRSVNSPVLISDVQIFTPLEHDLDYYLDQADKNRLEIKLADLEIQIAGKEVKIAQSNYYPSIDLTGNYFRRGNDFTVDGGEGIFDANGWSILATASWNFWEWGRTHYGKKEKLSRLSQAQHNEQDIKDQVHFEVKRAYLKVIESEKNIVTIEKALEQARENLRINKERYKEQVSTQTEVLDAQTLLTITEVNYVNALYDFKIAKAALQLFISLEVLE